MKKSIIKKLCQECVNSYGGKYGKVKNKLKNVTYIDTGRVEAHVGELEKYIVVVFRGSDGFEDWKDNLDFEKTCISLDSKIKVHNGFWGQVLNIRHEIQNEIINRVKKNKDKKIIFTGHSLGGALATIFSWLYFLDKNICITFGSPRVGNRYFVNSFNNIVKESFRYVNGEDSVCKVPTLWMGYKHVKGKIKIGQKLSWKEKLLWIPRKIFGNPMDHYPKKYLKNL